MYSENAACDIYIGKEAGDDLLKDIRLARKSVRIVSPYLSPALITQLIYLRKRNVEVELITADRIEDYKNGHEKNIYQLIEQNRSVNHHAIAKRDRWRENVRKSYFVSASILIATILCGIYIEQAYLFYGFFPVLASVLLSEHFRRKVINTRIYSYTYSQLFPFKVYLTHYDNEPSDTRIHSKIYLIDDRIAYLGSLNFTASGTKFNHETRIRTEDPKAVRKIQEEFFDLMHYAGLPEKDIQQWGRQLYTEPIN